MMAIMYCISAIKQQENARTYIGTYTTIHRKTEVGFWAGQNYIDGINPLQRAYYYLLKNTNDGKTLARSTRNLIL